MKCWTFVIVLQLAYCTIISGRQCVYKNESYSSNAGREFIFGILDNLNHLYRPNTEISIDVVSESAGNVTLEVPYLGIHRTYAISARYVLSMPVNFTIQSDGTFKDKRGIRVTSTIDVVILVNNNYNSYANSAFTSYVIFPVETAGTRHIVSSYEPFDSPYSSRIMVTGLSDNTFVSIDADDGNGNATNITLNRLEVFQLQASDKADLTGATVRSDKPVVVVSGTGYAGIPSDLAYTFDHIASQMLPTDTWSNVYIVPPVKPMTSFLVRILSDDPNVNVTFTNSSNSFTVTPTSITEFFFTTDAVVITADAPIGVVQYGAISHRYDAANNPFMTPVPGIYQYSNKYTFSVPHPSADRFTHQIIVIVPNDQVSGILLDDVTFQSSMTSSLLVAKPLSQFVVLLANVTRGYHTMSHQNKDVPFGILVTGLQPFYNKPGVKYGYYAGVNLNGTCTEPTTPMPTITTSTGTTERLTTHVKATLTSSTLPTSTPSTYTTSLATSTASRSTTSLPTSTASTSITSLPTSTASMPTTSLPTTTASTSITSLHTLTTSMSTTSRPTSTASTTTTSTASVTTAIPKYEYMCFACDEVSHLQDCYDLQKCSADQVCYVQQTQTANGVKFRSGCMEVNQCTKMHASTVNAKDECVDCCHGSYCNNRGCGDSGFPSRDQRGPVCYDCGDVVNATECRRVSVCTNDQVCRTEVSKLAEYYNFKLGCSNKLCSLTTGPVGYTPECVSCCESDYCNLICKRAGSGLPDIVG